MLRTARVSTTGAHQQNAITPPAARAVVPKGAPGESEGHAETGPRDRSRNGGAGGRANAGWHARYPPFIPRTIYPSTVSIVPSRTARVRSR